MINVEDRCSANVYSPKSLTPLLKALFYPKKTYSQKNCKSQYYLIFIGIACQTLILHLSQCVIPYQSMSEYTRMRMTTEAITNGQCSCDWKSLRAHKLRWQRHTMGSLEQGVQLDHGVATGRDPQSQHPMAPEPPAYSRPAAWRCQLVAKSWGCLWETMQMHQRTCAISISALSLPCLQSLKRFNENKCLQSWGNSYATPKHHMAKRPSLGIDSLNQPHAMRMWYECGVSFHVSCGKRMARLACCFAAW